MASSRSQEIRVGIVTVVGLAALIGGIMRGKGAAVGVHSHTIRILFPHANGVEVGAAVTLHGVRKGSVTKLEVVPEGVRMTVEVERAIPIYTDASASLEMMELMGEKKIEIDPGKGPAALPENAVIPGRVPGDIAAILATAGEMTADAQVMLRRLDSAVSTVNGILSDPEFRGRISSTLANVEQTSATANRLVVGNQAAINQTIGNLHQLSGELKSLVARTGNGVDKTMVIAQDAATDARKVLGKVDLTVEHADSLVTRLDGMLRDIKTGGGAASMLLYDKAFADELQKTVREVRAYVNQIGKHGINLNVGLGRKP